MIMTGSFSKPQEPKDLYVYNVVRLNKSLTIDANWDKSQWQKVKSVEIKNLMGDKPKFIPSAQAKMMYDDKNVYVIFRVMDQYVRCIEQDYNGPVWGDSCVEFFFAPDSNLPLRYFNLEINCGGIALMHYNIVPRKEYKKLDAEEIKQIEIAHSLPQKVDPEMTDPVNWTIEYRIPLRILENYSSITHPAKGIIWRANFYKIADKTSNPHYMTWSYIGNIKPDFHLPQFFGMLKFN